MKVGLQSSSFQTIPPGPCFQQALRMPGISPPPPPHFFWCSLGFAGSMQGWSCFTAEVARPFLSPILIPSRNWGLLFSTAHPWVQPRQSSPADTRTSHAGPAAAAAARKGVSPAAAVPASSLRWLFRGSSTRSCSSGPCQAPSGRRASLWLNFKLCYEDCFPWPFVWHTFCLKGEKAQGYLYEQCLKTSLLV